MDVISHDPSAQQFSLQVSGERAVLDYTLREGVMTIIHTTVPTAIGGRGIAARLMHEALATAHSEGWKVVPVCSYAAAYMKRLTPAPPPSAR